MREHPQSLSSWRLILRGRWFAGLFRGHNKNLLMFIPPQALGSLVVSLLVILWPLFFLTVFMAFVPENKKILGRLGASPPWFLVKNDFTGDLFRSWPEMGGVWQEYPKKGTIENSYWWVLDLMRKSNFTHVCLVKTTFVFLRHLAPKSSRLFTIIHFTVYKEP